MKTILLSVTILILTIVANAQTVTDKMYADYENINIEFAGFGNSTFDVIQNPYSTGINTSDSVGVVHSGNQTWSGLWANTSETIKFTNTNTFKIKVYSPIITTFNLKIEDQNDQGTYHEVESTNTVINQWEEIEFDFSGVPTDLYNKFVLFFAYNDTIDTTFYFDDLFLDVVEADTLPAQPIDTMYADYENTDITFAGYGNCTFEKVTNPHITGINTSNNVGLVHSGNETWSGMWANTSHTIMFENNNVIRMKIYSPIITAFNIKIEQQGNSSVSDSVTTSNTTINEWEILEFDFSNSTTNVYNKFIMSFDFNGTTDTTFYFDDLFLDVDTTTNNSIHFIDKMTFISVYPNPTTDYINFDIKTLNKNATVVIYSSNGKKLLTKSIKNGVNQINISNFRNGLYFLQIEDGNRSFSSKIIKE